MHCYLHPAIYNIYDWTFTFGSTNLAKRPHHIEATALDANLSSETASADFTVRNPGPGVSTENNPWCLPAAVIAVVTGVAALILSRKSRPKGAG
jgi:hypothetical protein